MEDLTQRMGDPFQGRDLQRLIAFLREQGLEYDNSITHTLLIEDGDTIAATGSCHGNVVKCIAVAPDYQGQNLLSVIMTHLVSYLAEQGIGHYFGFTKPKNRQMFCSMGLYPVAETEQVLLLENRRDGLKKYMEKLKQETAEQTGGNSAPEGEIGAIIANCNPFTLGHRYLIETAARQCRWLHLFILSTDSGMFSAQERFEMARRGTQDIPNVILHRTSDYLISPAVFPTYFIKERAQAFTINCMLDIEIFRSYIAKALHITSRFVGTEPTCSVTRQYNDCLKEELSQYGIDVYEVPRRTAADGRSISASDVRQAIQASDWETAEALLQETTVVYLRERGVKRNGT